MSAVGSPFGGMARVEPMLVSTGPMPGGAVVYQAKIDGWRCQLSVDGCGGQLRAVTRAGRSVARVIPELAAVVEALDGRRAVFDGELIAGDGMPASFYRLGRRMATSRTATIERGRWETPLTFVAFDLVWLDGVPLVEESYRERRQALDELEFEGPHWVTLASHNDGDALYEACEALGAEGVVGRRLDRSPYLPGRRAAWVVKRKCQGWVRDHAPRRLPAERRRIPSTAPRSL